MTSPFQAVLAGAAMLGACLLVPRARAVARLERWRRIVSGAPAAAERVRLAGSASMAWLGVLPGRWMPSLASRRILQASGLAVVGWLLGSALAPPIGGIAGAGVLAALPRALERRRASRRVVAIERQLADLAEATAQAVRSGLSVPQALEFAVNEAESPLRDLLGGALARQALGVPLDEALRAFGEQLDTDDTRLLLLVVGIHSRSGGDLAEALDEVARTIRYRIGVRQELRALSAQGRVSGVILGSLPIAFFLVLSLTSRRDLDPVLRSPAGMAMVGAGLLMQGLAFLWIRRLLRVAV